MIPSPPLFGSPLVTALARSNYTTPSGLSIPGILASCFQEIEDRGLGIEGIFRKSGSTAAVNQLQLQFEEQSDPFLIKFPSTLSTHSLAGLFKRYLQQLPEPVIPRHHQSMFLNVFDEEKYSKETLKRKLKEVCKTLPHEHLHLLQFLMEVVYTVQLHQEKNQMSLEALAIIFAPTCVRIDGVSQLMPGSIVSEAPSYTSLPVLLNKQQLFKRARQLIWKTLRIKKPHQLIYINSRSNTSSSSLLYRPDDLLQLELVKESTTWIRIFEFMMSYPEVFTTLTNPLKSQKYIYPVTTEASKLLTQDTKIPSLKATTATRITVDAADTTTVYPLQNEKTDLPLKIDFSSLEFTESHELLKTFDNLNIQLHHHLLDTPPSPMPAMPSPPRQQEPEMEYTKSASALSTSKYITTLQNWKSREEENPAIILPQKVVIGLSTKKRQQQSSLPPDASDWVKAIRGGLFGTESNDKKSSRQSLFHQNKATAATLY